MARRQAVLVGVLLFGGACSAPPVGPQEICGNGVDDDRNGLSDCADPACANTQNCPGTDDAGYFGSCAKCGQSCSVQSDCVDQGFHADEPLAQCQGKKCQALLEGIRVRFEVDTAAWFGVGSALRSLNTRVVLKTALDGRSVNCEVLKGAASSKLQADANQIERSGRFNLLGYDVTPINAAPGSVIVQPLMAVGTGSDFIIWTEIWAGLPDSNTKLPSGNRLGWGCFESGPAVEPIYTHHHWPGPNPQATSRTIRVVMPSPQ